MTNTPPWVNVGDPDTLPIRCRIDTGGQWMDINDGKHYNLEASTLSEASVQWRRKEVQSPYLPGTWVVNAVKDNVLENLVVWVSGDDHYEMSQHLYRLTDALDQLYYAIWWRVDTDEYAWHCQVSDYQIVSDRDLRHASVCKVVAKVPRYPEVEHAEGRMF